VTKSKEKAGKLITSRLKYCGADDGSATFGGSELAYLREAVTSRHAFESVLGAIRAASSLTIR